MLKYEDFLKQLQLIIKLNKFQRYVETRETLIATRHVLQKRLIEEVNPIVRAAGYNTYHRDTEYWHLLRTYEKVNDLLEASDQNIFSFLSEDKVGMKNTDYMKILDDFE